MTDKDRGGTQVKSLFGTATQFRAAMGAEGLRGFVVTRDGEFRAQLAQISLNHMRLSSIEEALPSISFISVPRDKVLAAFALDDRTQQVWGGCRLATNDLILVGPGQRIHRRSEEASYWGIIWLPVADLRDYSCAVLGKAITLHSVDVWRLPASLGKRLRGLQKSVMGSGWAQSVSLLHPQAAHGLEQQIIDMLMEALSARRSRKPTPSRIRGRELMELLERLPSPDGHASIAELTNASDISEAMLLHWCEETLGMDPTSYIKLRCSQAGTN